MKLYFNGCSHTWGDDLVDPDSQAWPALISKNLNCEFINDSVYGGTNDRIMYRTIKNAPDFDKFYIAWTCTSGFTRFRTDNNHIVNFNPHLTHSIYGNSSEFKDYGKLHYAVWHNELYAFKLWLQNIILLQRYFESIKKSYVMINADNNYINRWSASWSNFNAMVQSLLCFDLMNDDQLYAEHNEIQLLIEQIDQQHFLGWNTWWISDLTNQYPVGETGHLLEQGHQAIADYILTNDTN
ncbi:DUF6071 family protein [Haliscomenobacter sp.]|uniref:DUF6071 family protein n=1 Tax=Haliscomenobacter sp. TaxID=2717303 RepID=UPI003365241C